MVNENITEHNFKEHARKAGEALASYTKEKSSCFEDVVNKLNANGIESVKLNDKLRVCMTMELAKYIKCIVQNTCNKVECEEIDFDIFYSVFTDGFWDSLEEAFPLNKDSVLSCEENKAYGYHRNWKATFLAATQFSIMLDVKNEDDEKAMMILKDYFKEMNSFISTCLGIAI